MRAAIAQATAAAALGVLPSFLTGGLITQLRADLHVSVTDVGLATAALFVTAAILAPAGARIGRRLGTGRSLVLAPTVSAAAFATGALSVNLFGLMAALVLGGVANAIAQPVANIRLAEFVPDRRLGFSFGLKQAAVPAAALFSGLTIPGIALVVGWRWVWVVAGIAALGLALYGLRRRSVPPPVHVPVPGILRGRERLGRRTMLLLTAGALLSATVGTSVGVFFVDSAVASGFGPAEAGLVYAGFSAVGVITRVLLGWFSDRHPTLDPYLLATALICLGIAGNLLFAVGVPWTLLLGALLAYVLGWAWPGLLQWSVVRDNRADVAAATGFFQSGSSMGAGLGPIFFGIVVGATSYRVGWLTAAGVGLGAAVLLGLGTLSARGERTAGEEGDARS